MQRFAKFTKILWGGFRATFNFWNGQFSRYGVPGTLRTNNRTNLVSSEMKEYLHKMGIEHRLTTPLWPRANGKVERQNRSLLKAMRVAHAKSKNWRSELNKFLLAYRSTAHNWQKPRGTTVREANWH